MKPLRALPAAAALWLLALTPAPLVAQSATTEMTGFMSLTAVGGSDTVLSFPMVQPSVYEGAIQTVSAASVTVPGTPWTAAQFVYNAGATPAQTSTYYLEFTSGNLRGFAYQITANTVSSLTLDTQGDDLTNIPPQGGAAPGDSLIIRPYWKVRDVFADKTGTPLLDPRPSDSVPADDLLFPDLVNTATNKTPNLTIYYVTGTGWHASSTLTTDPGDAILPPNRPVIIRRRKAADLPLAAVGQVSANRSVSYVPGGSAASANDTYLALRQPVAIALANAGLRIADQVNSAIRDSANPLVRGDELLAFPTTGSGYNRAPVYTYYYLANQGWRLVGSSSTTVGTDVLLQPGAGYVLRRKAGHAGTDWTCDPNF